MRRDSMLQRWSTPLAIGVLMVQAVPGTARAQAGQLETTEASDLVGPAVDLPDELDAQSDAASQRIGRADPTTIGGYGEVVFTSVEDGDNEIDFHRFVVFVAHRFADWIAFYSEVEIEHATEVEMEQALIDLSILDSLTIRAGLLLVPVGLTNLYHEPALFHGANRPRVDRVIVPTTWREAGLGVMWTPTESVTVEGYVLSSLDAGGFSSSNGIRGGRQDVSEAFSNDVAGALRVTVEPVLGLALGLSGYFGTSGQDRFGDGISVPVGIGELDVRYRNFGLEARAEVAIVFIGDTVELSAALEDTIGEQLFGWYAEVAYDVLHPLATGHQLLPFVRWEAFDTHAAIADELRGSDDLNRTDLTAGLSYRPIPQIIFKADYQVTDSALTNPPNQWDLGFGWMF